MWGVQGGYSYGGYNPTFQDKEVHFGEVDIVLDIECWGNLKLKKTNAFGNVFCVGDITLINASCHKEVNSEKGCIIAENATIGSLVAARDITIDACKLGAAKSDLDIEADDCLCIDSIYAKNHIVLRDSTVLNNVSSEKGVNIENSTIKGTLTCSSNHLIIEGSTIGTIYLRCQRISNLSDGMRLGLFESKEDEGQQQILRLRNCIITNVIFEGNNGEIILERSEILGSVTGGQILD